MTLDAARLEPVYRRAFPEAVERGIPPHVTVLFPFVPRSGLDDVALDRARGVLARHRAFEFALVRIATFPTVVWLAPEPDGPFRELTATIHAEFPEHPPYGGEFDEVIPHATLATVEPDDLDAAVDRLRPQVEPLLPLRGRADEVTLLVEDEPDRWRAELALPLDA